MTQVITGKWINCAASLPPNGEAVNTKIDHGGEVRNEGTLVRKGNLWWLPDGSMYVYYRPTHWRAIPFVGMGI